MDTLHRVHQAKIMPVIFWNFSSSHMMMLLLTGMQLSTTDKTTEATPQARSWPRAVMPIGTYGSMWPSLSGSCPESTNRITCTTKKELAKLMMSFSASLISSLSNTTRSSPWSLMVAIRQRSMPRNRIPMLTWLMRTATRARIGDSLNQSMCCSAPPASMAAKPQKCASKEVQALRFTEVRSRFSFLFSTKTSTPSIQAMLLCPVRVRT
mmetsp:Transcript_126582/g.300675  ORF Transcript_126582/g.300675 Transcript_126582/m.300675 type:complete len:209 (-) Transcript_126582:598-1224(-)